MSETVIPLRKGGTGVDTLAALRAMLGVGIGAKYTVNDLITISGTPTPRIAVANAFNTSAETTIFTLHLGAGEWLDYENIQPILYNEWKQNFGSARTLTVKVKYGSDSFTFISAASVANSATLAKKLSGISLTRVGTTIYMNFSNAGDAATGFNSFTAQDQQVAPTGGQMTGIDFSTQKDLVITAQWQTADSNIFINVPWGYAIKK